ncbi:uncharacterized protein ACHE_10965S [Aspergillus chevalieri]|uniref:Uncharacterized protein n=1 Tax=Aspergillus chevalieri TaxID=182096 RepID=A0A7R7VF51_ASPCH|nr:uncharacterized protein ACHE_10965S [Aspergillus chevalieri]BCR83563.1 hypothetical protein ACHE_10965S [Aspergillus chevalieri]
MNAITLVLFKGELTEGEHRKYWIFITNICAISRFCLETVPDLKTEVKNYVKHMELGDALLAFILDGPHPSLLPQNSIPSPWNKANSKGPATEPNLVKQQPEASGSSTPVGQQQSVDMAYLEGAKGQSTRLNHPPQTVQRPVLADSAPIHQPSNQQPPQEHSLNEQLSPTQGTAGPKFTSFRQQPPSGLNTASAPALAQATGEQNSLPTTQFPFTVQPGQVSQYASNTINQGSSNPVQPLPTSSTVQQFPQGSHPVMNPGVQPLMAQPFQMHNAQQSHATPLNVASKQLQTPAAHPVPTQVHSGQPTGLGWAGQSQVPPPTMQSHQGPVVPSNGSQPTTFFPGSQWATIPPGFTQTSSQGTVPVQQGSITLPTQALSQPHGQPGTNMFTQPPATQSQTEADALSHDLDDGRSSSQASEGESQNTLADKAGFSVTCVKLLEVLANGLSGISEVRLDLDRVMEDIRTLHQNIERNKEDVRYGVSNAPMSTTAT